MSSIGLYGSGLIRYGLGLDGMVYRPGKQHLNADAVCRLPLLEIPPVEEEEDRVLMLDDMDDTPMTTGEVRR